MSLAAKGLCLWVRAMETYGSVAKDVAPKRLKLKTAQDNLSKKQTALAAAQTQLAEVLAKVQALKVSMISRHVCFTGAAYHVCLMMPYTQAATLFSYCCRGLDMQRCFKDVLMLTPVQHLL